MMRWGRRGRRAGTVPVMPPLPPLAIGVVPSAAQSDEATLPDAFAAEERVRPIDRWRRLVAVAEALAQDRSAREELARDVGYPPESWDQFCRDMAMRPPPRVNAKVPGFVVLVDAMAAAPFLIRATLRSLQDQSHTDWQAQVIAPATIRDHPVGSFATTDARIRFVDSPKLPSTGFVAALDAGTVLDAEALAWLSFALLRTGADAAFADHDHGVADPGLRLVRADPMLFGAYDAALVAECGPPAIVAGRAGLPPARIGMLAAETITGVPRVLATRLALSLIGRKGKVGEGEDRPGWLAPAGHPSPARIAPLPRDDRIAVVIPTRDAPAMLARSVDTLRATARMPERLDIVIVDNRSVEPATAALFEQVQRDNAARVVPFDAPFNFSLASNIGAAASDAPLIVFANNDIEMLSHGWDDELAEALADPMTGAVGARLIYPGRTIQHAGIAFGFGPGGAEHEGVGVSAAEPGPGHRYVTSHAVAAVTGAFLGVRRVDFDRIGGFDAERFTVAYNDLDLCLRLREIGLIIRYVPAIEAIHFESVTRGINETRTQIGWDEGERADLLDRWGDALFEDPGVSPYWLRGTEPFELLREPSLREIIAHIDRTAQSQPWKPVRRLAQSIRD